MSTRTLYTAHGGFPAVVGESRLGTLLNPELQRNTYYKYHNFNHFTRHLDVPITDSDVERWTVTLRKVAPPSVEHFNHQEGKETESGEVDAATSCRFVTAAAVFSLSSDHARRRFIHKLAPFPNFNPQSVISLPMTTILKTRRKWLPYRQRFPVYQQRMQLLDTVLAYDVVTIVGSAGSGRTLQLSLIFSEKEVFRNRRIIVVSANEIAVRLTVLRLREERGETSNSKTIASVLPGRAPEATEGTVVLVTTAEVLLRQLLCDPALLDVAMVIFDDVHVRTEATELCCALLRERISELAVLEANARSLNEGEDSKKLHILLNCPDETCSASFLDFFALAPSCRATNFTLLPPNAAATQLLPSVFYIEETIQWLYKCRLEGSFVCYNPQLELASYVEKVEVATEIMAAADADFSNESKCRSYWCRIITQVIWHYHFAESQNMKSSDNLSTQRAGELCDLPFIVVLVPSLHWARVILEEVRYQLFCLCKVESVEEPLRRSIDHFEFYVLAEFVASFDEFLNVAQGRCPRIRNPDRQSFRARVILFMTPHLAQTTLPPRLNIGLIVDCARTSIQCFDSTAMCDRWSTEYANALELRYRRYVASNRFTFNTFNGVVQPCIVIQLIPRSILFSAQYRRQSADPGQHPIFCLSFERYLTLYQIFQAREEAIRNSRLFVVQDRNSSPPDSTTLEPDTVITKLISLVSSQFIGIRSVSASRYEHLRRIFLHIEGYLVAAGHIQLSRGFSFSDAKPNNEPPEIRSNSMQLAKLRPMGILSMFLLLPTPVARLLVFSSLFGCFVEATAVAAMWLTGDIYQSVVDDLMFAVEGLPEDREERLEHQAEQHALLKEARKFFAWNSVNDVVSNFNLYRMWLNLHCDKEKDVNEREESFLSECKIPRSFLLRILDAQINLHELFNALVWKRNEVSLPDKFDDKVDQISFHLARLPDEAVVSGHFHTCLTAALYPNYVRLQSYRLGPHNTAQGFFGLLLDFPPIPETFSVPITSLSRSIGVYADFSLLCTQSEYDINDASPSPAGGLVNENLASGMVDKAFMYLSKTLLDTPSFVSFSSSQQVAVLDQAMPMLEDVVVLICGESCEKFKEPPQRCRGWSSVLTYAWRNTKRAQLLGPPAQLPPVSVAVQIYDTVNAPMVTLITDSNLKFMLRATTSRWLQMLRMQIQEHLCAMSLHKGWTKEDASASATELILAWSWWQQRQQDRLQWLHQERQVSHTKELRLVTTGASSYDLTDDVKDRTKLCAFYIFQSEPGIPERVVSPVLSSGGAKRPNNFSNSSAQAWSTITYNGKLPTPDMEQIIQMCVKSVSTKRTREHESQLLHDNPDLFVFLDPENEFHEYYLYLLRQAAPDMEVLGDDLEELFEFLTSLENELRAELGLPPEANSAGNYNMDNHSYDRENNKEDSINRSITTFQGKEQEHQVLLHDIAGTETEESYVNAFTGLQVETAAVSLRKLPISVSSNPVKASSRTGMQSLSDNSMTSVVAEQLNSDTRPPTLSVSGTLLDKLMAMKTSNSSKIEDDNRALLVMDPPQGESTAACTNTPEVVNLHNSAAAIADTPPTAAELMELLTGSGVNGAVLDDHFSTANHGVLFSSPTLVNPLSKPPPPLPARVVDERKPSVLVYPLPDRRYGNVPLILAKALGDTMNIRVGPTTIVGSIGRINVPNTKVEARALSLRKFMCVGKKVYIFKNDRIIDNPDPTVYERLPHRSGRGSSNGKGTFRGGRTRHKSPHCDNDEDISNLHPHVHENHPHACNKEDTLGDDDMDFDPTMVGNEYLNCIPEQPQSQVLHAFIESSKEKKPETHSHLNAIRIGVLSDSEDDVDESASVDDDSRSESSTE